MLLKEALGVAIKFLGQDKPYDCVTLTKGHVRAMGLTSGCDLACPDLDIEVSCAGIPLKKILDVIDEPTLKMVKGRKLEVSEAGTRYAIQAIPQDTALTHPEPPGDTAEWVSLSAEAVQALVSVAKLGANAAPIAGVRLTPQWACAGTTCQVGVAWGSFARSSVTCPVEFFRGLTGPCEVFTDATDRKVWVRDEAGSTRWTTTLAVVFPDESVMNMVKGVREHPARKEGIVDMAALANLARRSVAIAEGKVDAYRLELSPGKLELIGGSGGGRWGSTSFSGEIEADASATAETGVSAHDLLNVSAALSRLEGVGKFAMCDRLTPVALWGGDTVVVETLITPVYLS